MADPVVVTLPVSSVSVLEDRAQVERRGAVKVPGGRATLRVQGVSPLIVDRSLNVDLRGATLVDARVARVWKEKPKGGLPAAASELRLRVRALAQDQERRAADVARLASRFAVARSAYTDALRHVAEQTGVGMADPGPFGDALARVRAEEASVAQAQRVAAHELQLTEQRLAEASSALARSEEPLEELVTTLDLTVEGGGEVALKVRYLVPCAVWRPRYRATLRPAKDGKRPVEIEAEATVWQRTAEDWDDVELCFSTARPTLGAAPPALTEDRLGLRDKTQQEQQAIQVAIREEVVQTAGESRPSAEMPGLDDGGEVQLIPAPGRASIPPDGQPYRVPLFAFEALAETELLAAPELSPLVSLVARLENRGRRVLLAGPVDLVRDSGFVGRGQLRFAAPGETVKLSFGSEDSLRVVRHLAEERGESRLTGRRTTTRTVRLSVSNAGGDAARIAVDERVPVSEVAAVEVKVLADRSSPRLDGPSADGIVRFALDLPARSRRELTLVYELTASSKVAGL